MPIAKTKRTHWTSSETTRMISLYIEGKSISEIASLFDTTEKTIHNKIHHLDGHVLPIVRKIHMRTLDDYFVLDKIISTLLTAWGATPSSLQSVQEALDSVEYSPYPPPPPTKANPNEISP